MFSFFKYRCADNDCDANWLFTTMNNNHKSSELVNYQSGIEMSIYKI